MKEDEKSKINVELMKGLMGSLLKNPFDKEVVEEEADDYELEKLSDYNKDKYNLEAKRQGCKIYNYRRYNKQRNLNALFLIISYIAMIMIGVMIATPIK